MGLLTKIKSALSGDSEVAATPVAPEIPEVLRGMDGEYRVLERLTKRGYPWEFLGKRSADGTEMELLFYHPDENHAWWERYADEELRLIREIRHDNVARLFDFGWHGDQFFAVSEHVDGPQLANILMARRRQSVSLPNEFGVYVGIELSAALSAGHTLPWRGENLEILHHKIYSWNVGLRLDGTVKLLDWGLDVAPPESAGVLGPRIYALAPEAAKGERTDSRADIFQLGALIFEALSGQRAFAGENDFATLEMITQGQLPDFKAAIPSAPASLHTVLAKAMALVPTDRHQTATEFAEELRPHLGRFGKPDAAKLTASLPPPEPGG